MRHEQGAMSGRFSLAVNRINPISRVSNFSHDGLRSYFQCLWSQLLVCYFLVFQVFGWAANIDPTCLYFEFR